MCNRINYALVTYNPWDRVLMKSYYKQDHIDNVFFGSSHVYYDVNPEMLGRINGMNYLLCQQLGKDGMLHTIC